MYDFFLSLLPENFFVVSILPFLTFILGLATLVKCADYFVDHAEELGIRLRIPDFIIGITIIGIGTSLPELGASLATIFTKPEEVSIVSANVLDSNIANILLGVGLASLVRVIKVDRQLEDNDLPFLFSSTAVAVLFLMDGNLSRFEGFLLLGMFAVFLCFSIFDKSQKNEINQEKKRVDHKNPLWLLMVILFLTGAGIVISADFTIGGLTGASKAINLSSDITAIFLAVGTSFPEIMVSFMAVKRGNMSMAVGNILGSNIGNILGILGISAAITTITVSEVSIATRLPFIIVATLFFIFSTRDNKVGKWEGMMAITIFLAFVLKLFYLA